MNLWYNTSYNERFSKNIFIKRKTRTLHEVHDIYLRLKKRQSEKYKQRRKFLDENVKLDEKTGHFYIYEKNRSNDKHWEYRKIKFQKSEYGLSWTLNYTDKDSERTRKLESLILDEEKFKLGDEFRKLSTLCESRFLSRVEEHLKDMVSQELREKIKGTYIESLIVKIGTYEYVVKVTNHSHWHTFEIDFSNIVKIDL